jgi:hypothetical protein
MVCITTEDVLVAVVPVYVEAMGVMQRKKNKPRKSLSQLNSNFRRVKRNGYRRALKFRPRPTFPPEWWNISTKIHDECVAPAVS